MSMTFQESDSITPDDKWIEAEIQRELETLEQLEGEDEDVTDEADYSETEDKADAVDVQEDLPDSWLQYVNHMQRQTEEASRELDNCDDVLQQLQSETSGPHTDKGSLLLAEIAKETGESPTELKTRVLGELQKEEEEEQNEVEINEGKTESKPPHQNDTPDESKSSLHQDEESQQYTLKPEEGVVAEIFESDILEQQVRQKLKELNERLQHQEQIRQQEVELQRKLEEKQRQEQEEKRRKQQMLMEEEQQKLQHEKDILQAKLEQETEEEERRFQQELARHQEEIDLLVAQSEKEKIEVARLQEEDQRRQEENNRSAAISIQRVYRGYRVRKEHSAVLKQLKEERLKSIEEERIKQIEAERRRIEEEEKRVDEERRKIEEEKKRQEEEKKRQEEARREEERRKEEERKQEELKRQEEEKRRLEELKKKEEEEKRRKEEERQRKIEEEKRQKEEQRKKEEEEKRKREGERKKIEEEKKQKEIEEKLRKEKEESEKRAKEAEAKRKQEEEKRKAEEKKQKEEEERKKIEAEKRKKADEEKSKYDLIKTQKVRNGTEAPEKEQKNGGGDMETVILSEAVEKCRLKWMKDCKPWSTISSELKSRKPSVSKKPARRPSSAKKLPPLSEAQILTAAKVSALVQVTTVELCDLPGCTLGDLGQCVNLKSLSIHNSGLVALDGLDKCANLTFVDAKRNAIEMVSLQNLKNLTYLDLSHNRLSTLHGLDGCTGLRCLLLKHNRITKLGGGLEPLISLHTLDISNNQLTSTRGLQYAASLQNLEVSHNHLPALDGIEALPVLRKLQAAGNTIAKIPDLSNQVLLNEVYLDDNSISTLKGLTERWLPLLQRLSLNQNSVSEISPLANCILLKSLHLDGNQISDIDIITSALQNCPSLTELTLLDNPVTEETQYRFTIEAKLKVLSNLDNKPTSKSTSGSSSQIQSEFTQVYLSQCLEERRLHDAYVHNLHRAKHKDSGADVSKIHTDYFNQSHELAVEQRYSHEYGDMTDQVDKQKGAKSNAKPAELNYSTSNMKNKFDQAVSNSSNRTFIMESKNSDNYVQESANSDQKFDHVMTPRKPMTEPERAFTPRRNRIMSTGVTASTVGKLLDGQHGQGLDEDQRKKHKAATKIQSVWRGYSVRRDIEIRTQMWLAASIIQSLWRGYAVRKHFKELKQQHHLFNHVNKEISHLNNAATKIQALWRGYSIRRRLEFAAKYAKFADEDDEFLYGEVDLDAFNFDEADLEAGWAPPDTPQLPVNHPVLRNPETLQQPLINHQPVPPLYEKPPQHTHPRQAWRNLDSPQSDHPPVVNLWSKPPLPPVSRPAGEPPSKLPSGSVVSAETHRSHLSKKGEKLSEEWGFTDSTTAHLMMQRARKLKYNAERKKKISKLDPKQRLALFRKFEESTKLSPIKPHIRKQSIRKEYFQAREEEQFRMEREKVEEFEGKAVRTFEWVHTQVGSHDVGTSCINRGVVRSGQNSSEESLPRMDPVIVAGGRSHLVASPATLELQSVENESAFSSVSEHRRRSLAEGSSNQGMMLPTIKTNSAPVQKPKEKMSWRNKPTTSDAGWGGGRKRTK